MIHPDHMKQTISNKLSGSAKNQVVYWSMALSYHGNARVGGIHLPSFSTLFFSSSLKGASFSKAIFCFSKLVKNHTLLLLMAGILHHLGWLKPYK